MPGTSTATATVSQHPVSDGDQAVLANFDGHDDVDAAVAVILC